MCDCQPECTCGYCSCGESGWGGDEWEGDGGGDIFEVIPVPVLPSMDYSILINQNNDTDKRLNDIRTDPSEVGVWIRGETGKNKIKGYSYNYTMSSGGYDWKTENDKHYIFYGLGATYSNNTCDEGMIGDTKSLGYNLYGSLLTKQHHAFVDVVVKYGRLEKEYNGRDIYGLRAAGSYDKDLVAFSIKYGKRIAFQDDWYYEPSLGYAYGRVSSADFYDRRGYTIHNDAINSKVASIGLQVGKNIKGTEVFTKVSVLHDFDGKLSASVPNSYYGISVKDDMGGTWVKLAVGAARKVNKDNSFYIDIEKDFGNKVKKPYAFSVGYRHTF